MNKQYFDESDYDLDDIDSDLADMIKSLTFRNRPDRKAFCFYDDDIPHRTKRNHHRPRSQDNEIF